jgi:hypothetical protein
MKRPTEVLPELIVATLSLSLCFTPRDLSIAEANVGRLLRITGFSTAIVLFGKSYTLLMLNEEKFRTVQEKELIAESADIELFTYRKSAELEKEKLRIKRELMEVAAPNFQRMYELEVESTPKPPEHPEISEAERTKAAQNAIEQALAPTVVQPRFSEEELRKHFPENMDSTTWKGCLKALQAGHSKDEIVADVLGCKTKKEMGLAYFEFLKQRFM